MKDISICIPHFGPDPVVGLWATIESCVLALKDSGLTYDFRVCVNGAQEQSQELWAIKEYLSRAGLVGEWFHKPQQHTPPKARNLMMNSSDSKYLFLLDNHCLVYPDYFTQAVTTMDKNKIDYLHSVTKMFTGFRQDYEYHLTLEDNFWANEGYEKPLKNEPYRIAAAGHGGVAFRNSTWKELGGYWDGFDGYAGDEMYVDMKYWLLGKEVWLDPKMIHIHWCGQRNWQRRGSEGFYLNMLMVANIIGGQRWLDKVYKNIAGSKMIPKNQHETSKDELEDIIDVDALSKRICAEDLTNKAKVVGIDTLNFSREKSKQHAAWVAARRKMSLDELLVWFKKEGIRL